ncbi:MAG: NAD-dependent epimerase/dehydratase family protein [Pseudobdellovibrionaceae bacterium]
MKIAVIGGSGFIGTELTPLLQKMGHTVILGDIIPSDTYPELSVNADLTDPVSLEDACRGCDLIINLAAVHRDDVRPLSLYDDVNVKGSDNLCQVADKLGIKRIIFTSSVAVYGFQKGMPNESNPHLPFNPYGRTKSEAEDVYRAWEAHDPATKGLVIIRPTVVFGPGNRGNVYNLLRQIASGAFVMIGDGQNRKSMAYVGNVAAFIAYSLKYETGVEVFNYVDKPDFTMNQLVSNVRRIMGKGDGVGLRLPYWFGILAGFGFDVLARLTGKTFPVSRIRIQKFCSNTVFDASKVHEESGFSAPYDLEAALLETMSREFGAKSE